MLSAFSLKVIAIVCMLIDHVGAVLLPEVTLLRLIGRLSFPIFCFLIAEGFSHTKSAPKYLMRLGLFALISEIPYNLAFHKELFYFGGCNVFITLFLGLLAIMLFDTVRKWEDIPEFASFALALIPVAALCRTAETMGSDYGKFGVMLIFIFHLFKNNRSAALLVFALCTLLRYGITATAYRDALRLFEIGERTWYFIEQTQLYCILSAIPIALYDGKRGHAGAKWLFYAFYPAHLIIIWVISLCL